MQWKTTVAWKMALKIKKVLTLPFLSRQNIKDLPSDNNDRYADAVKAEKGAYVVQIVKEDRMSFRLPAGSEVATLVEGAFL